ncbi:MAG TPA: hypothetical protein VK846_09550 [Candidatus Limnocylindria bacterium]|nr:hypothetical protein [Candidatus Limnocylindria bacterium]
MNKRHVILAIAVIGVAALGVSLNRLSAAKRHAQSIGCANQIVVICFSGRLYAADYNSHFPTNFTSMSNELVSCKALACPSDGAHKRCKGWETYTDANCSYVIVNPGVHEDATNAVFIRCSVHGHLGDPDSTVFDGVRRRTKFN